MNRCIKSNILVLAIMVLVGCAQSGSNSNPNQIDRTVTLKSFLSTPELDQKQFLSLREFPCGAQDSCVNICRISSELTDMVISTKQISLYVSAQDLDLQPDVFGGCPMGGGAKAMFSNDDHGGQARFSNDDHGGLPR